MVRMKLFLLMLLTCSATVAFSQQKSYSATKVEKCTWNKEKQVYENCQTNHKNHQIEINSDKKLVYVKSDGNVVVFKTIGHKTKGSTTIYSAIKANGLGKTISVNESTHTISIMSQPKHYKTTYYLK